MVAAKAKAAAQRASAAASRKDANLKHVVISEKWDKKAAKYLTPSLPFPFNDKQVYENAMRQPLGRQYNPDAAFRNLTRPAVLKSAGVVIEPARFSKSVEQYNAGGSGKGRAVVTIAGGMQLEGQAAGTGAGGVGKGVAKKKKKPQQQQQGGKGAGGKGKRLHEAA
jgi:U3 small nucleolar RNA-associated protein 14